MATNKGMSWERRTWSQAGSEMIHLSKLFITARDCYLSSLYFNAYVLEYSGPSLWCSDSTELGGVGYYALSLSLCACLCMCKIHFSSCKIYHVMCSYCECENGHVISKVNCGHQPFICSQLCKCANLGVECWLAFITCAGVRVYLCVAFLFTFIRYIYFCVNDILSLYKIAITVESR